MATNEVISDREGRTTPSVSWSRREAATRNAPPPAGGAVAKAVVWPALLVISRSSGSALRPAPAAVVPAARRPL